ncbi:MAG: hypothetical protein ACRCX4_06945 [Bacteroidales bacterium]
MKDILIYMFSALLATGQFNYDFNDFLNLIDEEPSAFNDFLKHITDTNIAPDTEKK